MRPGIWCVLALAGLWAAPSSAQDKRTVESNGATIAFRDLGDGDALLLLHGFGGTGAMWNPLVSELSRHYRLIIPDLRGHGESTNPVGHFTHDDAAADILGLLDALDLESVGAVGFSSGGMTLLHMATSQPDRLEAIALVGTTPYLPEAAREILRGLDADAMPMSDLEAMGLVHGDTAQARYLLRQFADFEDSYTDVNFTPPLLSTITASTLVVHGDRDPFFPIAIPVEVYRAIPESYLMVFPDLGHEPFPPGADGRNYFIRTLLRFFGGEWSP